MKPSEFVKVVVNQYTEGRGIFQKKINAEELIPVELDDLHKALYIFYVLQLDYAMKSQILYNGANRLYRENKEFFTPKFLTTLTDGVLTNYLKEYLRPRYINEAVKRYCVNTDILLTKYESDPRKIFENISCCQDVLKRLKDFRGFGPKIGNFFVRTMINTFGYTFSDIDTVLPPVDVHDVRIAYLLGYTDTDQMSQKNIDFVKKLWNKACLSSGKSWLIFDKALWLLGSEGKPKTREDIIRLLL
ncbi:hypothetical protein KKC62_00685 [Patescibacteria group bacterium]|nr:hypothetical protein [Patescibacteria group bacterium]MBU1952722.1 hypothetical protein [Patescibacteria group bacterium]